MIQVATRVFAADNSGALLTQCIRVLGNGKTVANIGDLIVVAVKKSYSKKKVKSHDVHRAVVVRTVKPYYRKNNNLHIGFEKNEVVLVDKKNNPFGNRIKGPVTRELRRKKLIKILSLAPMVI